MARPVFLFAHGAGAPSTSAWMKRWATHLEAIGEVVRFDYPYMQAGKKAPDPLPKLIEAHRSALADVRRRYEGPVVLIGKSMGGRVGCHLALEEQVSAIVCLGYPLKGMGKAGKLRDAVLLELGTKILFVQGTRDNLCPLDLLDSVRKKMSAKSELHVVEGGNHSLEVTQRQLKESGETQANIEKTIMERVREFLR